MRVIKKAAALISAAVFYSLVRARQISDGVIQR